MFFSCSEDTVYHQFLSVESSGWDQSHPLKFDVEISDTVSRYDVLLEVRNNDHYPYENLWLFVTYETPQGDRRKDTLDCVLADVSGRWQGTGMSLYTLTLPYEQSVIYPRSGTYSYTIRQGMRKEKLKGITDIGLKISKRN